MPRITIEKSIPIKGKISKIETTTYDLPDQIVFKNKVLSFDSYHKAYTDFKDIYLKAIDYIDYALNDKEDSNETTNTLD